MFINLKLNIILNLFKFKKFYLLKMQFVKEIYDLPKDVIDEIRKVVNENATNFENSELYSLISEENFQDISIRSSKYRLLNDPKLFLFCQNIIKYINELNEISEITYLLIEDHITHIKYQVGDFFAKHKDYIATVSNQIEEYTLIINLSEDDSISGGETKIRINDETNIISRTVITPNSAILFRKDLEHEGLPIKSGEKNILTLNVWKVRNNENNFPLLKIVNSENKILKIYNFNKIKQFSETLFYRKINFQQNIDKNIKIVEFKLPENVSEEQFEIIDKILNGIYLNYDEIKNDEFYEMLDYFNINFNQVLVNYQENLVSVEGKPMSERMNIFKFLNNGDDENDLNFEKYSKDREDEYDYPSDQEIETKLKEFDINEVNETETEKDTEIKNLNDKFITVHSKHEQTLYITEMTKSYNLPYIPFRMIFIEGFVKISGDTCTPGLFKLALQPIWVSLGDYDNLLYLRNLGTICFRDKNYNRYDDFCDNKLLNFYDIIEKYYVKKLVPDKKIKFEIKEDYYVYDEEDLNIDDSTILEIPEVGGSGKCFVNLLLGLKKGIKTSEILKHLLYNNPDYGNFGRIPDNLEFLPSADSVESKYHDMFHIDKSGKISFSEEESKLLTNYLQEHNFMEEVQKRIYNTKYILPQHDREVFNQFYCNESVYGQCCILEITGMVNLN